MARCGMWRFLKTLRVVIKATRKLISLRFALQATVLGIRNAFLNQPVEVAAVRPPFAAALGLAGLRPDLVVRFGRGPTLPRSLRRPVEAVMDSVLHKAPKSPFS